jgi:hypothetical protein
MTDAKLTTLLNEMDLPSQRKDFTQPENLGWLVRNIGFRNQHHPQIREVVQELRDRIQVSRDRTPSSGLFSPFWKER